MIDTLATWHRVVAERDESLLDTLLADDVVFHSPVVHTPQRGREITTLYLRAAMVVLNTPAFRYVREIVGPRDAMLEFVTELDGLQLNGIDLIRWGDDGRITEFKVMVRPLKAINALHQAMGALLQRLQMPSFEQFKAEKLAAGFDEVLERVWQPGQVLETHTHPFAVEALVVKGGFVLSCAGTERTLGPGDRFSLAREQPHAEHYGPQGATFWAARRHAA